MPTKSDGGTDWSKLFMGFAVALVFVFQSYHQIVQDAHSDEIKKLHSNTLSEHQIDKKIDTKTKGLIRELIEIQKTQLEQNRVWFQWQKDKEKE